MLGIIIPPMAATVAGFEPDIAPKNADEIVVIIARLAGSLPNTTWANLIRRFEIPPFSIISPDKMKKGMAMNGKLSIEVNIL
jgi:hypothetical protein